jgi:NAD(P)H-hydrate repair Nnr-like enzyme with NAD(P)H-hydrate dehydratase domain
LAGDLVRKEKGNYFTASDVLEKLSEAIKWAEDF